MKVTTSLQTRTSDRSIDVPSAFLLLFNRFKCFAHTRSHLLSPPKDTVTSLDKSSAAGWLPSHGCAWMPTR
jgi:hypothetical protein